ncbi:unnamed protein product [Linum tenue]|uniref:Neuroguidin n=1 Tax=Linum tenue TaxID=586396 RepID=A0AAV0PP68_9ROSI|nr:unnamed protein product [Linum tenue]
MADQGLNQRIKEDNPQLASVLKEMKGGLDLVRSKVESLTAKVKANNYPTADGISYLEAKNLLLLNYCQSLVYYILRKAKGLSVDNHPVVQKLVETRLFLEKIRPIDKKLEYQIQKLTKGASQPVDQVNVNSNTEAPRNSEDLLKYRPNPDMLNNKSVVASGDAVGVYRPPKLVPVEMEGGRISREKRNEVRKEKEMVRRSRLGFQKDLFDDLQGKPEEVKESFGNESREFEKYQRNWEAREKEEEDQFIRAPITKKEKKELRNLKRSRGGLDGLTDGFDIKFLPLDDGAGEQQKARNGSVGMRKHKKHKLIYVIALSYAEEALSTRKAEIPRPVLCYVCKNNAHLANVYRASDLGKGVLLLSRVLFLQMGILEPRSLEAHLWFL